MAIHRIAAAHAASILLDKAASIALACDMIEEAGSKGIELLCFPETFVPGFPYWINLYPPGNQHGIHLKYLAQSVDIAAGDLDPVYAAARKAGVSVVLGISERDGGTMYNAQAFIGPEGDLLGLHRKLQPTFAERMLWGQGDGAGLIVTDMPVGRVGGLICYEHMMNLARQALISDRMQVHCASWPTFATLAKRGGAYDETVEILMRSHAITGQCSVILAENFVTQQYLDVMAEELGPQAEITAGGGCSAIYAPSGAVLVGPHKGASQAIIHADVELDDIYRSKVLADTAGHSSRPEILQLQVNRSPAETLVETGRAK